MSDVPVTMVASGCHIFSGCGYPAPSLNDFNFNTPVFTIAGLHVSKPILLGVLCAGIVVGFFWAAFRKPKLVPHGIQNVGEVGVLFVRDQILRPAIGKKGDRFLPFLVSLFFFIWVMNIMEVIPIAQFPVASRIGFPWSLVIMVWLTYMWLGFKHQGFRTFIRNLAIPGDVPWWILPLLVPVELFSNILIRPFTLGVRLFANMFAGHILLLVFTLATWYLATVGIGLIFAAASFAIVLALTAFELLIQALQAFIFTTLTATYIAGSLEPEH
ncbi:MAG TPA: F0F1 ATP synthase subunit A [Streptosporangiaceae bacterium]|nr:F0F1 ATP synthase subunit A [Streptosporangiaceae bacterium]